jgi:hypothetical protein
MRLGLNIIRITAAAERDWQCRMQESHRPRREGRGRRGEKRQAR